MIAINDGSTDGSDRVLDDFAKRDSRFRVVHQKNAGLVASLNLGLSLSSGEFVARMDADDVALPQRFKRQVDFLRRRPDIAVVGSSMTLVDADGILIRHLQYPAGADVVGAKMREGCTLAHPTVMARRDILRKLGGYRPAFQHAEDYDLWLRLIECHSIDNLSESLLLYRHHGGNVSVRFRQKQALATFFARHCAMLRASGSVDPFDGETNPIELSVLGKLALSVHDEMNLRMSLLKEGVEAYGSAVEWLEENLDWVWNNRSAVRHGKMVRRALIPAAVYYWGIADKARAELWFCRGFRSAPWSTLLALLRSTALGIKANIHKNQAGR